MTAGQQQQVADRAVQTVQIVQHMQLGVTSVGLGNLFVVVMPGDAGQPGVVPGGVAVVEGERGATHDIVGDRQCLGIDDQIAEPVILPDIAAVEAGLDLHVAVDLFGHRRGAAGVQHPWLDQITLLAELFFLSVRQHRRVSPCIPSVQL